MPVTEIEEYLREGASSPCLDTLQKFYHKHEDDEFTTATWERTDESVSLYLEGDGGSLSLSFATSKEFYKWLGEALREI